MNPLEAHIAVFRCQTCGETWKKPWSPTAVQHNVGVQFCPRDSMGHKYIKWENFDEFRKLYAPFVRRLNTNEGNV